ncbi:MAG: nucleotidyltransferase family protein, partial [Pseudomonadota bacterium]
MSDFPIIVLAAGSSKRMGGVDKLMQQVDGVRLVRRQAMIARASTTGPVIVTLPSAAHARWRALDGLDVTRIEVADAAEGMNASIRAAVSALPDGCAAAMILLGDLPDLFENDLNATLQGVDLNSDTLVWRGATSAGKPGHPVVFAQPMFAHLAQLHGDSGGREAMAAAKGHIQLIPLEGERARSD